MTAFRIADSFTDSLGRLTAEEQKSAKLAAFELQINPANPGFQFHRVDRAKDKCFWSIRVNLDLRIIVHRTGEGLLLCYVDHHDAAYAWAERRKIETHPNTGAAQIVEIRETVREVVIPSYVHEPAVASPKPALFANLTDDQLLMYGVPAEWLQDVKSATEDTVLEIADHLPSEAAEAILELATGGRPTVAVVAKPQADPFAHPDAQRRFRVMNNLEELQQALEFPWDKWTIFLHPVQREVVEKRYSGPVRVSGTAGTGKTIVALHRAVHLARENPESRILLTTFSGTLADALRMKLRRLIGSQPHLGERIDVEAIGDLAMRLHRRNLGKIALAGERIVRELIAEAAGQVSDAEFPAHFLESEWQQIVDAWGVDAWEGYRDIKRLGRKTRLNESKRAALWAVFARVRQQLNDKSLATESDIFHRLARHFQGVRHHPYDHIIVDESQDLSVSQLRFIAALAADTPEALFFAGDLGQRIFQQPFSWLSLGIEIRGRSKTLRINYRTSHQIRSQADRLLDPEISDVDGNTESRRDTVSVFNGPPPLIRSFESAEAEIEAVAEALREWSDAGLHPNEIGVFVRSEAELSRAESAVATAKLEFITLRDKFAFQNDRVAISTMHLAKGLEFRAVVVMACDDEVIPSQQRIEAIGDPADLEDVYNTERHLLYVACTRARDRLLLTAVEPASEFLEDLI